MASMKIIEFRNHTDITEKYSYVMIDRNANYHKDINPVIIIYKLYSPKVKDLLNFLKWRHSFADTDANRYYVRLVRYEYTTLERCRKEGAFLNHED